MLSELRARAWQVGTFAAGGVAVILAVSLGVTTLQKNAAVKRADNLYEQINAPITGYIARAAVCKANVAELTSGIERQNKAVADLAADGERRKAQSARDLAAAQATAARYRVRAEDLARAVPVGVTQCDRLLDADAMIQEAFR